MMARPGRGFLTAVLAILASTMLPVAPAHAGKMMFGTKEYLRKIQDVEIKGRDGESLYLGYKYGHHSFVLPYMLTDDGYILGINGQSDRYYKLDAGQIAALQAAGKLPDPLPPYEIGALDYAMGYLLWLILPVIGVSVWLGLRKDKRQKAALPHIAEAFEHHRAGRADAALAAYGAALEIHPDNPEALLGRGQLHQGTGNVDAAITDYSRAIKANGKNDLALLSRGQAFQEKGLLDQALADLNRVVKLDKGAGVLQARAGIHFAKASYDAAIKDLTAAIKKEPGAAILHAQRAACYERKGDAQRAAADNETAQRLAAPPPAAAQPTLSL